MLLNPKQKPYFIFIVFLIISIALFYFVILKLDGTIRHDSQEIVRQKKEIAISSVISNKINIFEKDLSTNSQKVEEIQKVLIKPVEVVNFISDLEDIASATSNQITLTVDKPDKKETKEKKEPNSEFPALYFSLNISGTFPNLIKFLYLFENMPYWSDVYTFNITSFGDPKKEIVDQIETVLKIKVYTSL